MTEGSQTGPLTQIVSSGPRPGTAGNRPSSPGTKHSSNKNSN